MADSKPDERKALIAKLRDYRIREQPNRFFLDVADALERDHAIVERVREHLYAIATCSEIGQQRFWSPEQCLRYINAKANEAIVASRTPPAEQPPRSETPAVAKCRHSPEFPTVSSSQCRHCRMPMIYNTIERRWMPTTPVEPPAAQPPAPDARAIRERDEWCSKRLPSGMYEPLPSFRVLMDSHGFSKRDIEIIWNDIASMAEYLAAAASARGD